MGLVVVVVVLEEEVLVAAVAGKGDGRDAQAGEGVLEAVPAREGAGVSPGLTAGGDCVSMPEAQGQGKDKEMERGRAYFRSQGSYRGVPVDSLKARMLKPVMLGLGPRAAARSTLRAGVSDDGSIGRERASRAPARERQWAAGGRTRWEAS